MWQPWWLWVDLQHQLNSHNFMWAQITVQISLVYTNILYSNPEYLLLKKSKFWHRCDKRIWLVTEFSEPVCRFNRSALSLHYLMVVFGTNTRKCSSSSSVNPSKSLLNKEKQQQQTARYIVVFFSLFFYLMFY